MSDVYGQRLAPGYRALGLLQRGRDFETYDAWSDRRFARCVVKTLRRGLRGAASSRARLLQEGRLLTGLDHPHLVRGYEVRERPRPLVVMETLTGATVENLLSSGRRLAVSDVAHLGAQLCSALRALHSHGFLHLDVKPGNVIVEGGRAVLIDLSLAQRPGAVLRGLGTADYLSPEQARGGQAGPAADVWGLGLLLYQAATGVNPFEHGAPTSSVDGDLCSTCGACATCGGRVDYLQLSGRAPRAGAQRRLPRVLSGALDAALDPDPSARPTLAELDVTLNSLAGTDRPPW